MRITRTRLTAAGATLFTTALLIPGATTQFEVVPGHFQRGRVPAVVAADSTDRRYT